MKKILYLVLVTVLAAAVPAWGQNNQTYTLGKIPAGWTVKANGTTVTVTDSTAIIPAGATVVLTPTNTAKVKKVTLKDAPACRRIDLGTLTADFVAQDCDTLTGETSSHKVTIAAGATVILDGVTISASKYCIKCAGDATIILKDGTTNTLTSTIWYPALWVGDANTTLTIQGSTGKLNVKSENYYAGIGGGKKNTNNTCGNIRIEGGIITAEGGENAAGIGADYNASCGDITISGGTVTATGGSDAAGIGGSWGGSCGDITITSGITQVTATKGEGAPNSIGAGYGTGASCGTVTVDPSLSDVTVGDTRTISHAPSVPTGAINGKFTINASGDQVYFSQGNLQYQASTGTWRFAEHQYDYIGNDNASMSETYSGWIDLYRWGTSGIDYTGHATLYRPWEKSFDGAEFNPYSSLTTNLYDGDGENAGKADWGYNAISNGGNTQNSGWRTLKNNPTDNEWQYIFNSRTTANEINSTSDARYTQATINTDGTAVNGVILFPDGSIGTTPAGVTWGAINASSAWGTQCTTAGWEALEAAGCVFLPASGKGEMVGTVSMVGSEGHYWSSSSYASSYYAYGMYFFSNYVSPQYSDYRNYGLSVRLVKDAQ